MRVIFYTFLSILGISLSVIILMPSLFDINNYKGKIENLFYNKTNNTLKIAGDISLSFLSGLRLSVKDISFVSNDGENLFNSEELLISPKFFPLLKGELLFNSVKIVKPTINITNARSEHTQIARWHHFTRKCTFSSRYTSFPRSLTVCCF